MPAKKGKTETKAKKPTPPAKGKDQDGFKPATEKDIPARVFRGHESMVCRVAMPADGRFALTTSHDGTVRQWDLAPTASPVEGQVLLKGEAKFVALAVTPGGERAAAGDWSGDIHLLDLQHRTQEQAFPAHNSYVGNLAFIPTTGELLSAAEDGFLRKWDAHTCAKRGECKLHFTRLYGVAASTDGRIVVGAAWMEGLARWDGVSAKPEAVWREDVAVESPVSVSADGRLALIGCVDGTVALWDLTAGQRRAAWEGHSSFVRAVALTPDGRFAASGGGDKTVRLWHVASGLCLAVLRGHERAILGIALTPDARRIASVSDDKTLRVWDIPASLLAAAEQQQKRGYMNAKVVLLGESGAGKSGLALRLWHDRWKKTESTHGMEIQRLVLPQTGHDPNIYREVWLWDLAGQPDYRLTHQLFMEQTALALLVFDPQDPHIFDTVGYWQNALRKITRSDLTTGILVAARCDRPGLRLTLDEVRNWAESRGLRGPVLTAAKLKTHPGAAELRDLISSLLPWEKMEFRSTMDNFPALKDAILAVRDAKTSKDTAGVVVTPGELETRVRKASSRLQFTSEDLRAVTGLLDGEGVLRALPYGDLIVLQPSWVNCYASTLVKLAGNDPHGLGTVPVSVVQPGALPDDGTPRLSTEDERQFLPALIALFLERALAWKVDTGRGPVLVFPYYARRPRPEPPPRPGRTVLYRFTGPLEEIYCTLVVRLHYSGLFTKTQLYRQAVDFHTATGKLAALTMKEDGERGELEIYFGEKLDSDVQASFQQFVHDHLTAKAAHVERLRNFFCPKCKEEVTDRKVIDAALAKNRTKILCAYCDPEHPGMIDLIDVLEEQFITKAGEAGADEAGRKANEKITTASMEGIMVGEVQTIVFAADQIYRTPPKPDEGVDGEIEFRDAKKKASGLTYRVQLKSGRSHLRKLKDGTERFAIGSDHVKQWARKGVVPLLLIIRDAEGRIRFMNATDAIRAAQKANPGKPVTQITFTGQDFTKEAVLRLRDQRLKS